MKLSYAMTERELLRGMTLYFKRQKVEMASILMAFFPILMLILILFVSMPMISNAPFNLLISVIVMVAFISAVAKSLTTTGRAKATLAYQHKHGMRLADPSGLRVLEAREAQLVGIVGGQEYALAFSSLREVREEEGYVLLLRDGGELFTVVPPSAFLDPAWRDTFVAELRRRMAAPAPTPSAFTAENAERMISFPAWTERELEDDLVTADWLSLRPFLIGTPIALAVGMAGGSWLVKVSLQLMMSGRMENMLLAILASILGLGCAIAALTGFTMVVFIPLGILPWVRRKRRKLIAGGSLNAWLRGEQRMAFTTQGIQIDRDGSGETIAWPWLRRVAPMRRGGLLLICRGFLVVPIRASAFQSADERAEFMAYLKTKRVKRSRRGRTGE